MMTAETMKEMEEFREANREYTYISHGWQLENWPNPGGSPRDVYARRLEPAARPEQPVRHVGKLSSGASSSTRKTTTSSSRSTTPKPWFDDPELKRQRRVVKYKSYAVEGKVKASLRNGFRWIKNKYSTFVHGY